MRPSLEWRKILRPALRMRGILFGSQIAPPVAALIHLRARCIADTLVWLRVAFEPQHFESIGANLHR